MLPSAATIYDRYLRDRGNVPNMFRTMAHRPEIFETILAHMEAMLNTGTLSKALKELVIVRTSQLNRTPIAWLRIRRSHAKWDGRRSRSGLLLMLQIAGSSVSGREWQSIWLSS